MENQSRLANSLEELNTLIDVKNILKGKNPFLIVNAAVKLFNRAKEYNEKGQMELAYISFMKFFQCFIFIQNSNDYQKNKILYDNLIGQKQLESLNKAEELAKLLQNIYESNLSSSNNKKCDLYTSDLDLGQADVDEFYKIIDQHNLSSIQRYLENIEHIDLINFEKYFHLLPNEDDQLENYRLFTLIIDISITQDNNLRYPYMITIPNRFINNGIDSGEFNEWLNKELDLKSLELWNNLGNFDSITIVDSRGDTSIILNESPLKPLINFINKFKRINEPIYYLKGGLTQLLLKYPELFETKSFKFQSNNSKNASSPHLSLITSTFNDETLSEMDGLIENDDDVTFNENVQSNIKPLYPDTKVLQHQITKKMSLPKQKNTPNFTKNEQELLPINSTTEIDTNIKPSKYSQFSNSQKSFTSRKQPNKLKDGKNYSERFDNNFLNRQNGHFNKDIRNEKFLAKYGVLNATRKSLGANTNQIPSHDASASINLTSSSLFGSLAPPTPKALTSATALPRHLTVTSHLHGQLAVNVHSSDLSGSFPIDLMANLPPLLNIPRDGLINMSNDTGKTRNYYPYWGVNHPAAPPNDVSDVLEHSAVNHKLVGTSTSYHLLPLHKTRSNPNLNVDCHSLALPDSLNATTDDFDESNTLDLKSLKNDIRLPPKFDRGLKPPIISSTEEEQQSSFSSLDSSKYNLSLKGGTHHHRQSNNALHSLNNYTNGVDPDLIGSTNDTSSSPSSTNNSPYLRYQGYAPELAVQDYDGRLTPLWQLQQQNLPSAPARNEARFGNSFPSPHSSTSATHTSSLNTTPADDTTTESSGQPNSSSISPNIPYNSSNSSSTSTIYNPVVTEQQTASSLGYSWTETVFPAANSATTSLAPIGYQSPGEREPNITQQKVSELMAVQTRSTTSAEFNANRPYGLTGILNTGNSCFINSVLQCLSYTIPLAEYFVNKTYLRHLNLNRKNKRNSPGQTSYNQQQHRTLAAEFAGVCRALWNAQYPSINPISFSNAISQYAPLIEIGTQQDSHELLTFLIDGLHEDLNRAPPVKSNSSADLISPSTQRSGQAVRENEDDDLPDKIKATRAWENYRKSNDSVIVDLMSGQLKSVVQCQKCLKESITYDTYQGLSLPLPSNGKCTLQDCLRAFLSPEPINDWRCPNCNKRTKAQKKLFLWKIPPILIIHLMRFKNDGQTHKKIMTTVDFPIKGLDLTYYCSANFDDKYLYQILPEYSLYAISNHYGTLESGHYTAFCNNPIDDLWYKFDDQQIIHIETSELRAPAAYILFYSSFSSKMPDFIQG